MVGLQTLDSPTGDMGGCEGKSIASVDSAPEDLAPVMQAWGDPLSALVGPLAPSSDFRNFGSMADGAG